LNAYEKLLLSLGCFTRIIQLNFTILVDNLKTFVITKT